MEIEDLPAQLLNLAPHHLFQGFQLQLANHHKYQNVLNCLIWGSDPSLEYYSTYGTVLLDGLSPLTSSLTTYRANGPARPGPFTQQNEKKNPVNGNEAHSLNEKIAIWVDRFTPFSNGGNTVIPPADDVIQ